MGFGELSVVEEQTSLAFQGKGLKFLMGSFWVPLFVGRPGSVSISRRRFLRAVMLLNLFFSFFLFLCRDRPGSFGQSSGGVLC